MLGIELERARDRFPRLLQPAGERIAGRGDAQCREDVRPFPERLFGPSRGLVVAAGEEMGECGHALHREHERIERAQAHRARQMLDRHVRLAAAKSPHRSAGIPRDGQVRIENERPVDERDGSFEIAGDITERKPAESERDRVVLAEFRRPPGQPRGFGDLLRAIDRSSR